MSLGQRYALRYEEVDIFPNSGIGLRSVDVLHKKVDLLFLVGNTQRKKCVRLHDFA